MGKPLNIRMEEPFHKGYVIIPRAVLEQCEELTDRFAIVPIMTGVGTKEQRKLKTAIMAIDMLNKTQNKTDVITAEKIASLLGVEPEDVKELIDDAIKDKLIEEDDKGHLVVRHTAIESKKSTGKKKHGEHKQLITLYHDKFLARFHEKPSFITQDFSVAATLVKNYSIEELAELIDKYFELDNPFLKSAGYKLRYLPNSINSIAVANADDEAGRRKKKIYKGSDYAGELSKEQLDRYIEGKAVGEWTGREDWAQQYEEAIKGGKK